VPSLVEADDVHEASTITANDRSARLRRLDTARIVAVGRNRVTFLRISPASCHTPRPRPPQEPPILGIDREAREPIAFSVSEPSLPGVRHSLPLPHFPCGPPLKLVFVWTAVVRGRGGVGDRS
jgi:hypothetical protein